MKHIEVSGSLTIDEKAFRIDNVTDDEVVMELKFFDTIGTELKQKLGDSLMKVLADTCNQAKNIEKLIELRVDENVK